MTRSHSATAKSAPKGSQESRDSLYRLLVDSVRDYAVFALDRSGHILTWNVGARHLMGYEPDEIIGKHFSTFYLHEDIAAKKPEIELETALGMGRYEEEGWRLRKDGSRFWTNVIVTPLRDEAGELLGFAKVTRDLTERRKADEKLRASEERFRLIVTSVKDYGIFMLDPKGNIVSWNEGAERIKGYRADEIIGRHFSTFYPAEDNDAGKPMWELQVAAAEGRFEDEGWRIRKDGSHFWANVIITALRNEAGTLVGFAKVSRDLTERRAAEDRAIEDARRLASIEVANRTKSEFLAAMSHELRTPLNAIGGYAELIEMGVGGPITDLQQEYIRRVRGSQQHLLGIITDLLNYSKIEAGQVSYDLQAVPVRDLVEAVLPLVEPQAAAKNLTMAQTGCEDLTVHTDRSRTQQILLNLLSNAVKFTPPRGTVAVECSGTGDRIAITVRDTGPGIPEDKREAIFAPFVQLGRSLTSPQEGTGLGLAISRDLARAMGGDITVHGEPNAGSEFTLRLPRADASSKS